MSRTIRRKNEARRSWMYIEPQYIPTKCTRCGGTHSIRWRGNTPICADGIYSETTPNRILKDARRYSQRKAGKEILNKFKAGYDIEDIAYVCNKDIRMNYYLT